MMIFSLLKFISLRQWALVGVFVGVSLFGLAFYLRGLEVRECRATIAAVAAFNEAVSKQAEDATKRLKEQERRQKLAKERALREINHNAPNPASPAIIDASRLLCNQGAAGCGSG